ncbi:hypothetical protein GQ44DRAFT_729590 [Phaeosphaeriaceae sp. PMI808]|nr:hypothetical protein GQ44DRAFT_729590 [Phaeosphaeriaceae sp. PMI808]
MNGPPNNDSNIPTGEDQSEDQSRGRQHEYFWPPSRFPIPEPYEVAFLRDAPDNEHSRNPLNRWPSNPSLPSSTGLTHPPSRPQDAADVSQRRADARTPSPSPALPDSASNDPVSHLNSPSNRAATRSKRSTRATKASAPFDNIASTHRKKGASSKASATAQKLIEGFEWTPENLALLGCWKERHKKGWPYIVETGIFPSYTEEELRELWKNRGAEAKKYYFEGYGGYR